VDPTAALATTTEPKKLNPAVAAQFRNLINASIANSTWGKYSSAYSAFSCYEAAMCETFSWPLSQKVFRNFAVWGFTIKRWQHTTIRAYLSALKFVHNIKGLSSSHLADDPILNLILKGALHASFSCPLLSPTRKVVTFPMLLLLTHKIATSPWPPLSKQVIYAASTTAFFASTRLIEILASAEKTHALDSDLTWRDILFDPSGSILIRIKQPKSGDREGEYVDLFPFPGYNCCPVKALHALKRKQTAENIFDPDQPVFKFASGANLTRPHFNKILAELLSDVCIPGVDTVSCHSFRAGIPSTLSLFPELATSDMIKGWGRWQSDCYLRYTRLTLPQREKIFGHIAAALTSIQPPPQH